MSSEREEQPATPDVQHHGVPGKALAAQREAMGWTVEQVADQLKLAVRQVVALEAGDYASLPSAAVVRGFVRAYAKILKMDAAPLVAMIPMDTPAPAETANVRRDAKPAKFSESSRFPLHGKRNTLPLGWIAAAVVVVIAAAAAWHFGLVPTQHATEAAPGAASTTVLQPPAGSSAPATETLQKPDVPLISVPSQNNGETPAAVPAAPAQGAPAAGNAPATATPPAAGTPAAAVTAPAAPAAAQPAAAQPVQAATETAAGPNALVLNVREDAWIQVKTASGKTLLSRLVKGGSTETVQVDEPATLVVGNAGAVNATLRGTALQLPMLPGKTVSRVTIK
jgi:cytoskeleton protein RodZ